MTDRYAVMGKPISHSKSPLIQNSFAEQTGQALQYEAILVESDFSGSVDRFFADGGKGLNITVPYKEEAWAKAEELSEEAELAGAVNTLLQNKEGKLVGHNTDGIGLVKDILQNHQGVLANKRVLILGAGGASRGIILPLIKQEVASITIANRTVSKAEALVEIFSDLGNINACGFEELSSSGQFDWVINATSASLQGDLPPLPEGLLANGAWCYDLMYSDTITPFCEWGTAQGASHAVDGLGMLVEQAAESFTLWRGIRPETSAAIKELRG